MPTVFQRRRKDGTKAKTFTADIWIDGKQFRRSTGEKTRRDAEKRANELEAEIRADLARKHEPLTLDKLMAKYWEEHAGDLPSAKSVKYHIKRLLEIMDKDLPLAELSNKHVADYVTKRKKQFTRVRRKKGASLTDTGLRPGQASEQGHYYRKDGTRITMPPRPKSPLAVVVREKQPPKLVSHETINRELDVLEAAYMRARDLWEHPVRPIKWGKHRLEKADRKNRAITPAKVREAVELARPISADMADAMELSFYTGMRKNELKTLIPARANLARRFVIVLAKRKAGQGYRERVVFLSTAAVALLSERIKPGMAQDKPLFNLTNERKIWEWVRIKIGHPNMRWHDWRHTCGSVLGALTKDPLIVKEQFGHSAISTSMEYIHTENERVLEALDTIPAISDRKVVALRPDADSSALPLPLSTTTTNPSRSSAQ